MYAHRNNSEPRTLLQRQSFKNAFISLRKHCEMHEGRPTALAMDVYIEGTTFVHQL